MDRARNHCHWKEHRCVIIGFKNQSRNHVFWWNIINVKLSFPLTYHDIGTVKLLCMNIWLTCWLDKNKNVKCVHALTEWHTYSPLYNSIELLKITISLSGAWRIGVAHCKHSMNFMWGKYSNKSVMNRWTSIENARHSQPHTWTRWKSEQKAQWHFVRHTWGDFIIRLSRWRDLVADKLQ